MNFKTNESMAALSVSAIVGSFVSSGESVVTFLRGTSVEKLLIALSFPNAIVFNLCIGFLVGSFVWYLNVYLPDRRMRKMLRDTLTQQYEKFRREVTQTLILSYEGDIPDDMYRPKGFRQYFMADTRRRWDESIQHLQLPERHHLLARIEAQLRLLFHEFDYVLHKVNIEDIEVHAILKKYSDWGHSVLRAGTYDSVEMKFLQRMLVCVLAARETEASEDLAHDPIAWALSRI